MKLLVIKQVFPSSRSLICTWHAQQNLEKKSLHLNRGKKPKRQKLYKMIQNLPLSENEEDYMKSYKFLIKSRDLSKNLIKYLGNGHNKRCCWFKCYTKNIFTCGTCITSRIEPKNNIYKKYISMVTAGLQRYLHISRLGERQSNKVRRRD